MFHFVLTFLHILVGIALIMIVLLQTGKGATLGAAFGGSSQTIFGSRGPASFLGKITTIAAVIFMLTSLTLAIYSGDTGRSSVSEKIKTGIPVNLPSPSPPLEKSTNPESKSSEESGQASGSQSQGQLPEPKARAEGEKSSSGSE